MFNILSKNGKRVVDVCTTIELARARIAGTDLGIQYCEGARSEYDNPELAEACADAEATYGNSRPYRVLVTREDRTQVNFTVMACSIEHAEDLARERYPGAPGLDVWQSTRGAKTSAA